MGILKILGVIILLLLFASDVIAHGSSHSRHGHSSHVRQTVDDSTYCSEDSRDWTGTNEEFFSAGQMEARRIKQDKCIQDRQAQAKRLPWMLSFFAGVVFIGIVVVAILYSPKYKGNFE